MSFEFSRSALSLGLCAFAIVAIQGSASAQQNPARSREFPPGALKRVEDLPLGRFRGQMDSLRPIARQRAVEWLKNFHFTEIDLDSLHVDGDGGVFYADTFATEPALAEAELPVISEAAVPVSPFPAGLIFHSRPGAPNVLYLNFTGENVSGTAWNTSLGRTSIVAVAFSTDADYSTFSDAEQTVIKRVWQRVAEDYSPFDIDVTTERPVSFGTRTANALITRNTDINGDPNPSSTAGGVAYVNVFAASYYGTYRPAWIYFNNLGNNESYISEAVSHEIGHNLGLSHDAKTDGTSYYGGHGSGDTSWGPIMGTGYNRNVSQWSKGEYYLANNTEDDLAIISGKISYRADDHGDTRGTATPLIVTGGTNVVSTTPENDPTNSNPDNKGVLEQNTDVDVFSFVTGSGQISLTVNPWIMPSGTRGGNLDVLLELYDETGALVMTNNASSKTYANIQATLPEGLYYLYVRNTGVGDPFSSTPSGYTSYASIGQYFISGYLLPSAYVAPPQASAQATDITQTGTGPKQFTVTYSDNLAMAVSTIDNSDIRVTGPNGYDRLAQFVSIDFPSEGTPRVVSYSVDPPTGGVWTHSDDGMYTIWLQTNQVANTEGAWAAAGQLGQFSVNVPMLIYADNLNVDSGWTLEPKWQYGTPSYPGIGPTSGFTGTNIIGYNLSGNYEDNLPTVYATSPIIDCSGVSSLTLRFQRWLRVRFGDTAVIQISTNGVAWTDVWSANQNIFDGSWQQLQYSLPDWVAGSPSVRLRWGMGSGPSQNEIGWNIDDIEVLGIGGPGAPAPNFVLISAANNPAWGTVIPSGGTYPSGSSVQATATPAMYYQFVNWTGDATGTNNPLTVVLNTNLSLQAVFNEILTTNHPTPWCWLASYGYTQNFESAVMNVGSNGMPVWQSYIAGLNPNDPNSQLRLSISPGTDGASMLLNWDAVTGRVYTVLSSTDPSSAFSPITNALNLPSTIHGFTNTISTSLPKVFYRLEVQKP